MSGRKWGVLLLTGLLLVGGIGTGCSRDAAEVREHVNPTGPKSPTLQSSDWFLLGSSAAETVTVQAVQNRSRVGNGYRPLIRKDRRGEPLQSLWAVEVPQSLIAGTVVGYSIKYADRVQLLITPTDIPYDQEVAVRRESAANTEGKTRLYSKAVVRGFPGVALRAGVMKWESGEVYRYPSVLEWQEPGEGEVPYITYALLGDVPPGQLQALAQQLSRP